MLLPACAPSGRCAVHSLAPPPGLIRVTSQRALLLRRMSIQREATPERLTGKIDVDTSCAEVKERGRDPAEAWFQEEK